MRTFCILESYGFEAFISRIHDSEDQDHLKTDSISFSKSKTLTKRENRIEIIVYNEGNWYWNEKPKADLFLSLATSTNS